MAKPFQQINKTELYQHYNLVKVYDGITLMKSLTEIKPNNLYAEYVNKKDKLTPPAWFAYWHEHEFKPIITRIEDKLNKHDELFKQHGWLNKE